MNDCDMSEVVGGLRWGAGFLTGVTPLGLLGVAVGAAIGLMNNYSSYTAGVSEGYDAYHN